MVQDLVEEYASKVNIWWYPLSTIQIIIYYGIFTELSFYFLNQ